MASGEKATDTQALPVKQGEDNRIYRRRSVLWPAKLRVGRHVFSCQIWNLSLGGARVRVDLPLESGTEVILSVSDRGDIPADVVWHRDEALGLSFNVSPEVIKRMFADRLHVLGLDDEI